MSIHDQFLASILADPTSDTPRLILADWLAEQDTEDSRDRAEFIRVQIELAKLGPPHPKHTAQATPTVRRDQVFCYLDREREVKVGSRIDVYVPEKRRKGLKADYHGLLVRENTGAGIVLRIDEESRPWPGRELEKRELELMTWVWPGEWSLLWPQASWRIRGLDVYAPTATYRRGFVEEVTLPQSSWLLHGPRLVRSCPLTTVRLMDKSPTPLTRGWLRSLGDVTVSGEGLRYEADTKLWYEMFRLSKVDETGAFGQVTTRMETQDSQEEGDWIIFDSSDHAHLCLSEACLSLARLEAAVNDLKPSDVPHLISSPS
jgi:uncharacterized protein (TIGR02996 family)